MCSSRNKRTQVDEAMKSGRNCVYRIPVKTLHKMLFLVFLQFLFTFANGQGPGNGLSTSNKESFEVLEEQDAGTSVGNISTQPGSTYRFSTDTNLFSIEPATGEIKTAVRLDRESLERGDTFDLFVQNLASTHLIEVQIHVVDINDNSPEFQNARTEISFSESELPGSLKILDTATDKDIGKNDVTTNYRILSGNEENKFQLVMLNDTSTLLYLDNLVPLDREERRSYQLNISAQDGGEPPRFGYLTVDITIQNSNDNPPLFDQSDYLVTINETVPVRTTIIQVIATDLDEDDEITYTVLSESDQFWIDPHSGELQTLKKLECYRQCSPSDNSSNCESNYKSCVVNVEATDNGQPPQKGNTYITVRLIDENDHDPVINFLPGNGAPVTVDEGASHVVIVSVYDQDDGPNGEVTVRISRGNERNHFRLDSLGPGYFAISVASRLDRERINRYNLTIEARDRGEPSRTGTSNLIILVNDINEHEPKFVQQSYRAELSEFVPVNTFVASVVAVDNDTGVNAEITYSIIAGNTLQWFQINNATGLVTTRLPLDRERQTSLTLTIRAQDGASTPTSSEVNLTIVIFDENDETPTFQQEVYERTIIEGSSSEDELITVTAVDSDQGVNGTVRYEFHRDVAIMYPGLFRINPSSGRVVTIGVIDREEYAECDLTIIAKDGGTPALSSTTLLHITVQDVNDNNPVFYPRQYFVYVREFKPAVDIERVFAHDPDFGANAQIAYSIQSGSTQRFAIDTETGLISTKMALVKSSNPKYTLRINAEDGGGNTADNTATVTVFVLGFEEDIPEFNSNSYAFRVSEDNEMSDPNIGRQVGSVSASNGLSQTPNYHIVSGDPHGVFTIDSNTGMITTARAIDRETTSSYSLVVTAVSSSQFAQAEVAVAIDDVNDNRPVYMYADVTVNVEETAPVGYPVYLAAAYDEDIGENAQLTYTLNHDGNVFEINQHTGMITLARSLVDVTEEEFQVTVTARDAGLQSFSISQGVRIIISDVNNVTPTFLQLNHIMTLSESAPVNDRFFTLEAEDTDRGMNGKLDYSITGGNIGGAFGVFPNGDMFIAKPLDRELHDLYVLSVTAQDHGIPHRSSSTNVTVHILDANDNEPIFVNDTFSFSLLEESPFGTFVGIISASDLDLGQNSELSFSFEGEQHGFEIARKSGIITSGFRFDREVLMEETGTSERIITVVVTDDGVNPKTSKATVIVSIEDVNDNSPQFTKEVYNEEYLDENSDSGTPIIVVSANDQDIGLNARIRYFITEGNADGIFSINEETGQISLAAEVDRETRDQYLLVVEATDGGSEPLTSTAVVRIRVVDANDNEPVFVAGDGSFSIPEDAVPGQFIAQFSATDADKDANAFLTFSITRGNIENVFTIDARSGKLSVATYLDYEARPSYELDITATDMGMPTSLSSEITVQIRLEDANDHEPLFGDIPIGEVTENAEVGTSVATVTATDVDDSSDITYEIIAQEPAGDHFGIDQNSGEIHTTAEIDREFAATYHLTVRAWDAPEEATVRRSAEKRVKIVVFDQNDNSPKFTSQNAAIVQQDGQSNTRFALVTAVDPDEGENGRVTYEITNSDTFSVESNSGSLYLRNLDPQTFLYSLTVNAKDNNRIEPRSVYQVMTIIVQSNEDNGAVFLQNSYSAEVTENSNSTVVTVSAAYSPPVQGAQLEYYITDVQTPDGMAAPRLFKINPTSGVMSTQQPLDREAGYERLSVEVHVVDKGANQPRTRAVSVEVTVLDENDSPPAFTESLYTATVAENVNPGHVVTTVEARDPDTVGTPLYSIVGGDYDKFSIDPSTGELRVYSTLDREERSEFTITVGADDDVHLSTAKVKVTVADVNDESPQFTQPLYFFDVPENTETGVSVGHVTAEDRDEGSNAQVTYSILSHWGRDKFSLHPRTGIFTLIGSLDYEEVEHYVLTVQAQDSGPQRLSSTVTVYMNVMDENDNIPIFDHSTYSIEVLENATIGASVMQVAASDSDSAENSAVRYFLRGGDVRGVFSVDEVTGVLSLASQLDREATSFYNLAMEARDQTGDSSDVLSGTALISITVKDVNDNAPEFDMPDTVYVCENSEAGTIITTLTVTDKDEGQNGVVHFSLLRASESQDLFSVTAEDGELSVHGDLNREDVGEYMITVVATDQGSPALSTEFRLRIIVTDDNDFAPQFERGSYEKDVLESEKVGVSLLTVSATDMDIGLNAELRYSITLGNDYQFFSMNSYTGELSIAHGLDYELIVRHELEITVQDLGVPPKSDTATVIINVQDVNDCTPLFLNTPYDTSVMENIADTPVYLTQVSARDDDAADADHVVYSVRGGGSNIFDIDAESGVISVLRQLDREQRDTYTLVVQAVDQRFPRRSSSTTINVLVADENDHSPVFEHGHYRGVVAENIPAPVSVAMVTAVDMDAGDNGRVSYTLENDGFGHFTIDPHSGEISTTTPLDREAHSHYELVVMATDGGMRAQTSDVIVYVDVADENDNIPQFQRETYTFYIKDPTDFGGFVAGVTALDADEGANGQVRYSLQDTPSSLDIDIDPTTGVMTAASRLQSAGGDYSFTVRARDRGEESRPKDTTVEVRFLSNDVSEFPTIELSQGRAITETANLDSNIGTVSGSSSRPSNDLSLHIVGGNIDDTFEIEGGQVKLKKSPDYESTTSYKLWIEVRDNSQNPPLSTYGEMTIDIIDANDNPPVFDKVYYNATVLEEQFPEIVVTEVTASDVDSGDNGRVTYAIIGGNEEGHFAISEEGEIRTQSLLDRETIDNYHLVIRAVDRGGAPKSATATVDIRVMDANDNPPTFTAIFNTRIPENAKLGTEVLKITTNDKDIGENARSTYTFTENPGNKFAINSVTGMITVAGHLDRETTPDFVLRIRANDGAYNSITTWEVHILDINDNAPQFDLELYRFAVAGEQDIGTVFGTISASDNDAEGDASEIFYYFKYPNHKVHVDSETGELSIREELIYNSLAVSENMVRLEIVASDRGDPMLTNSVAIIVEVKPANRHAPMFEHAQYAIAVAENSEIGLSVGQLVASDDDFDENAQITYSFADGNATGFFSVHPTTGEVTVTNSLSGRRQLTYVMSVTARDNGLPPRFTSVILSLTVLEENAYRPEFTSGSFSEEIIESRAVGSTIATVTARDNDQGVNGQVNFFITDGDPDGHFSINPTNGNIKVEKALDYEQQSVYSLAITVRDLAPISKHSVRTFRVTLRDINDYPPRFETEHIDAYLPENSPEDSSVVTVQAIDLDSPANAVIEYSLLNDPSNMFVIAENTGEIKTRSIVDFEQDKEYNFAVRALNPGTDLSGLATISVHITGVNEFAPQFQQHVYQFDVVESASPGYEVGHVTATDQDDGEDGVVMYYLVEDSNMEGFEVEANSGKINIAESIDRESTEQITLRIMAKNRGPIRGDDTDICEVRIFVGDANDPPRFERSFYEVTVSEISSRGTGVITVSAVDNDLNDNFREFEYTIASGNEGSAFTIDMDTGLISVNGNLDRETISMYTLRVEATDSGSPPQTGSTTVQITLSDVNDNGPYFEPNIPVGNLTEGRDAESEIALNLNEFTFDLDIQPNRGPYSYRLTNYNNVFKVGRTSGLVQAITELDRENIAHYIVSVDVTDAGSPPVTSNLQMRINVVDVNDNPSYSQDLNVLVYAYDGRINGEIIADVHPRDLDLVGNYECVFISGDPSFSIPDGCDLNANINTLDERTIRIRGDDGVHDSVNYDVTMTFESFAQETIDNSIMVRIGEVNAASFISGVHLDLMAAIDSALDVNTIMYNVHDQRTSVDIFIAARQSNGNYMFRNTLTQRLNLEKSNIEQEANVVIQQVNYNPCQEQPCFNNGECRVTIEREDEFLSTASGNFIFTAPYTHVEVNCTCPEEFTGPRCQEPRNRCQESPCRNQGTCISLGNGAFECQCSEAWRGVTCEVDVNECLVDNPCQNGATCSNTQGSYNCRCPSTHTGKNCDYAYNSCQPDPCLNNGQCVEVDSGYRCDCHFGYRGQNCEWAPKGFEPLSYISYQLPLDQDQNTIQLEFTTVSENALLLYYPNAANRVEFLALEVVAGRVRMSFALGNVDDEVVRLTAPVAVTDGSWFLVDATRSGKVGSLKVTKCEEGRSRCNTCENGDVTCHVTASGGRYQLLDSSDSQLYIGGVRDFSTIEERPGQLHSHDFVGCMRGVVVDGLGLLQLDPHSQAGVTDSCPRAEQACSADACGEGTCVDNWSQTNCLCPVGKMGPTCSEDEAAMTFGDDAFMRIRMKDSYMRQAFVGASARRKRQAGVNDYSMSIRFRTGRNTANILVSNPAYGAVYDDDNDVNTGTIPQYLNLMLQDGRFSCETYRNTLHPTDRDYADGEWHTATVSQQGSTLRCSIDGQSAEGTGEDDVRYGLIGAIYLRGEPDIPGIGGCLEGLEVNGERVPMNEADYSPMYEVTYATGVEGECRGVAGGSSGGGGDDNPSTQIVVIVICVFFGVTILVLLSVVFFVRMRRRLKEKQGMPKITNSNGFTKTNGDVTKTHATHDSGRSHPDSGYGDDGRPEEFIMEQHIQNELNQRNFNEREVRASGTSLHSTRPDIIEQDKMAERLPDDLDTEGIENMAYLEEPPEHYDLDNASSIAPSDVYDYAAHYKQYRKNPVHNKYKPQHKHLHQRMTPSPSAMLAKDRQSPASVSMQMARQSPASMLDRDSPNGMIIGRQSPHVKSQLTVENVNQLNRQTPVNQLSRASPAPNIPPPRGATSLRSTPLSGIQGLYPSNISSSSYSDRQSMPNGHLRGGSRPNSKLKQPINQVGVRGTPTKGLTIEEVNRLNARFHHTPLSTLDAISSSSEDMDKNDINRTDFTHSDLLDPAAHLPPESSSEDETNDSFTCSEFESDHEKIRNDVHPGRHIFSKLPAVNEHDDTDTTVASRGRNADTDSNRESQSTFFTASEDELPRRLGRTKLSNGALSLDYMMESLDYLLNWGSNYEKLVGVFQDIAMLPSDAIKRPPSRPSSSSSNRPSSRLSQQSPRPLLPPKPDNNRVSSPKSFGSMNSIGSMGSNPSSPRHGSSPINGLSTSPLPKQPLAAAQPPVNMVNGHIKQTSLVSLASSHDRQSSISSVHSSRSGRSGKHLPISPLANGLNVTTISNGVGGPGAHVLPISHSRSSSRSSVSSRPSHNSMYNPQNPYPPPPPPSIAPNTEAVVPNREEYV